MQEIWKRVRLPKPTYRKYYVSNLSRCMSVDIHGNERIIKGNHYGGVRYVGVAVPGSSGTERMYFTMSRETAKLHLPRPKGNLNNYIAARINPKGTFCATNLHWITRSQFNKDRPPIKRHYTLTVKQVSLIKRSYHDLGYTQESIAKKFKVSQSVVSRIIRGIDHRSRAL